MLPSATLPPPKPAPAIDFRSMGAKLIMVCVLALLMCIPAFWVSGLVSERSQGTAATTQQPAPNTQTVSGLPIRLVDSYRSVDRSLKYVLLFLGLVFMTYFLFETMTGRPVHPAQYILVGTAQLIFYLLLLSLAEKTGFDLAFVLAGGATVALLATNASWVFASRAQGVRAFAVFSLLYTFIYVLLRMEQDALLVGAIASFLAVGSMMYLTSRMDWYSSLAALGGAEPQPVPLIPTTPV